MKKKLNFKNYPVLAAICFAGIMQVNAQSYEETAKITAFDPVASLTDREASAGYGRRAAMSVDGDYAVVGASGVDVVESGTTHTNAGAVYVLKKVSGVWETHQKLVADDPEQDAGFGVATAVHGDYIIVGAAYHDDPNHPNPIAINQGKVYIYELNSSTGNWDKKWDSYSPGSYHMGYFGQGVDVYDDGTDVFAVIGQPRSYPMGHAYVYKRVSSTQWDLNSTLTDGTAAVAGKNQYFGISVAMHDDYLIIGSSNGFVQGSTVDYGGRAYIFHYNGTDWNTTAEKLLIAGDQEKGDQFGYAVDITDGYAIVGAMYEKSPSYPGVSTGSGAAYIYERDVTVTNDWGQENKLTTFQRTGSELFGFSVSITPEFALVGAPNDRYDFCGTAINNAGLAYLYRNDSQSNWPFIERLYASDATISDLYGYGVTIGGTATEPLFCVGAIHEDHDNDGNNTITNSGSVYLYGAVSSGSGSLVFNPKPLSNDDPNYIIEMELKEDTGIDLLGEELKFHEDDKAKNQFNVAKVTDEVLTINLTDAMWQSNKEETLKLEIINATGQMVYNTEVNSSRSQISINNDFTKGVYIVRIQSKAEKQVQKIVID